MKKWALWLVFLCVSAQAEVMFGIQYSATLGTVKSLYPNANYTQLKPAWLQPSEAFFKIDGEGMRGVLYVAFLDPRPYWSAYTAEDAIARLKATGKTPTDEQVERQMNFASSIAIESDDDALSVKWVRWAPDRSIPLGKLESRYGKASCSLDQTFDTICRWPKRSLVAAMSVDGKSVMLMETNFTEAERSRGVRSQALSR